jgi:glycyl-tRNA synthetase
VQSREDMYGVDASILMNQKVWQASGHVDTFSDPLVECSNCKGRFRADKIELNKCPDCGNTKLRYQDGCCTCDCGWSKCG